MSISSDTSRRPKRGALANQSWLCRCGHRNAPTHRKCRGESCGRSKPKRRVPAHAKVLRDMSTEDFGKLNEAIHGCGPDRCACCGRSLEDAGSNRDHDHRTGWARGLTCYRCNHQLLRNHDRASAQMILRYYLRVERYYA
jgi:hypothetical protein